VRNWKKGRNWNFRRRRKREETETLEEDEKKEETEILEESRENAIVDDEKAEDKIEEFWANHSGEIVG
jgi:hypothetical protein